MIHYSIAFDPDKNIGVAYNRTMRLLGPDDWCCFMDGDAMFLHPYFGRQISEYVNRHPECGLCVTDITEFARNFPLSGVLMLISRRAWETTGG